MKDPRRKTSQVPISQKKVFLTFPTHYYLVWSPMMRLLGNQHEESDCRARVYVTWWRSRWMSPGCRRSWCAKMPQRSTSPWATEHWWLGLMDFRWCGKQTYNFETKLDIWSKRLLVGTAQCLWCWGHWPASADDGLWGALEPRVLRYVNLLLFVKTSKKDIEWK